jgi:hypothetical protein
VSLNYHQIKELFVVHPELVADLVHNAEGVRILSCIVLDEPNPATHICLPCLRGALHSQPDESFQNLLFGQFHVVIDDTPHCEVHGKTNSEIMAIVTLSNPDNAAVMKNFSLEDEPELKEHNSESCAICQERGDWATTPDTENWFGAHETAGIKIHAKDHKAMEEIK